MGGLGTIVIIADEILCTQLLLTERSCLPPVIVSEMAAI